MIEFFTQKWPNPPAPVEDKERAKAAERRLEELRRRAIALGVAVDVINRRDDP